MCNENIFKKSKPKSIPKTKHTFVILLVFGILFLVLYKGIVL